MTPTECRHRWLTYYEEFLLGGANRIGYKCETCGEWKDQCSLGPAGLGGTDTGIKVLIGPHGCRSQTRSGKPFTKQIAYPDGRLEILNSPSGRADD